MNLFEISINWKIFVLCPIHLHIKAYEMICLQEFNGNIYIEFIFLYLLHVSHEIFLFNVFKMCIINA